MFNLEQTQLRQFHPGVRDENTKATINNNHIKRQCRDTTPMEVGQKQIKKEEQYGEIKWPRRKRQK